MGNCTLIDYKYGTRRRLRRGGGQHVRIYKYGKDKFGNKKYQCPTCKHQFAPDFVSSGSKWAKPLPTDKRKYPSCPVCGKSAFLHHDFDDYSNYRCYDKKYNHSFFQAKPTVKSHHLWLTYSEKMISSVCVTASILLLRSCYVLHRRHLVLQNCFILEVIV